MTPRDNTVHRGHIRGRHLSGNDCAVIDIGHSNHLRHRSRMGARTKC